MTTTHAPRTDIHRPSSEAFDPEKYDLVDVYDLNPGEGGFQSDHRQRIEDVNRLLAQGYRFASHQHIGQCGHCGARIRYAALMAREDVHELIYVGETCLGNRFMDLTKAQFDALRKAAQLDREKQAKLASFNQFLADHPELAPATYAYNLVFDTEAGEFAHEKYGTGWATSVIADILSKLRQYGSISEKQIAFVVKLIGEIEEKIENYAIKQAEREAAGPAGDAPTGRVQAEGKVIKYVFKESDYSPYGGGSFKMTVLLDNGAKVWGTAPSNIDGQLEVGMRIRFTATFDLKEGDSTFAFFKRPVKAEIIN